MAVSLILCTSLFTFQHKKQEFSCHTVFSKNIWEQTSNQSHLSSSWEQETLQVKWVIRAVVALGFRERQCLYLMLGMCFPWCTAVMWVSIEQLHKCEWSPLGGPQPKLLLGNTRALIFGACATSWTMQGKIDVLWWENAGMPRCRVCGLYVGVSLSPSPAPKSRAQSCWAQNQLTISRVWCIMKGNGVV